jgi:hypothetical protein
LQLLELLGLVELHHAKLALPTVEGLFADAVLLAHAYDGAAGLVSLAQYADLLLRGISFAFHGLGPFWIPRLTLSMAQFS